jgi:hypothetical protein
MYGHEIILCFRRDLLKFRCLNFSFHSGDGYCTYFILKLQATLVDTIYIFFASVNKKPIRQNHKPDDILFVLEQRQLIMHNYFYIQTRTKIDMLGHKDITKVTIYLY